MQRKEHKKFSMQNTLCKRKKAEGFVQKERVKRNILALNHEQSVTSR